LLLRRKRARPPAITCSRRSGNSQWTGWSRRAAS
jgi:hypothetical protein